MQEKKQQTVGSTHGPLSMPEALATIDALREALYDTVIQFTDARMRLRSIEKLAERQLEK
jgi:hypothetical protein